MLEVVRKIIIINIILASKINNTKIHWLETDFNPLKLPRTIIYKTLCFKEGFFNKLNFKAVMTKQNIKFTFSASNNSKKILCSKTMLMPSQQ